MRAERTMDSTRHFPGEAPSPSPVAGFSAGRHRILITACIAVITLMAWVYLIQLDRRMSASMEYHQQMEAMGMTMNKPWTAADTILTFAMWVVMMVGMMAGAVAPMLLLFSGARAGRGQPGGSLEVLL